MFSACKRQQNCAAGCMLHFKEEGFTLNPLKIHPKWELRVPGRRVFSYQGLLMGTLREFWPLILLHIHQLWLRYCYKREGQSEWEGESWNYCNMIPEQIKCGGKRNRVSILQPSVRRLYPWHLRLWPLTPRLCQWSPHFGLVLLWVTSC